MRLLLWIRLFLRRVMQLHRTSHLDAAPTRPPALRWRLPRAKRRNRYVYAWLDDPND